MKRILFSLLLLAPFFASAQSGSINAAAVRSRVTDSTTVATPTGYGVIYYNAQSNKFRVYQNGAWSDLTGGSGGGGGGISPSDNVTWTGTASWRDNNFSLLDNSDLTKIGKFELSGITTATTRTLTWPNASGTIALTSDIPSLSTYVVGPGSAVNNRVAFFDGTTGYLIKDSGLTLSGSNTGDQTITLTDELTGSGTGSVATTLSKNAITNRTLVTAASGDHVLISDVSDSGNLKKVLVSDLAGGSMVYPGAGIALSNGSAWSTSITDNSANWNTAFGWGDHAGAGYLSDSTAFVRTRGTSLLTTDVLIRPFTTSPFSSSQSISFGDVSNGFKNIRFYARESNQFSVTDSTDAHSSSLYFAPQELLFSTSDINGTGYDFSLYGSSQTGLNYQLVRKQSNDHTGQIQISSDSVFAFTSNSLDTALLKFAHSITGTEFKVYDTLGQKFKVNTAGELFIPVTPANDDALTQVLARDGTTGKIKYRTVGSIGSSGLTVGTSTITSGTDTRVLFDNAGVLGEYVISGTGSVAMTNSPVFTTPNIGTATGNITGNAATVTTNANLTGHITSTGNATSLGSFTKAQLDGAVSDGNVLYVGDVTQYTDELAQDAVGGMVDGSLIYVDGTPLLQRAALTGAITATAGSNATSLGSFTVAQLSTAISDANISGTNTGDQTSIVGITGSFAEFNTALTGADFATGGGTATGTNTGDQSLANTSDATSHTVTLTGGTSVQFIEGSNITLTTGGTGGAGTVTIASTGGGSSAFDDLTAAAGTNSIDNTSFLQTWNWNSLASNYGLSLLSSSTAASGNSQGLFSAQLTGANSNSNQSTSTGRFINNHTGTGSTNYAIVLNASSGDTNYAMWVDEGNIKLDASVNFELDATTGTKIGTSTTQKLGFYNATPVVRQSAVTTVQELADALTAYGLLPSSTVSGGSGLTYAQVKAMKFK